MSLAVCSLVVITTMGLEYEQDWILLAFVFFATITGYNFTKYAMLAKLHHRSLTMSLRWIQVFSLGCFVAMCYFGVQLSLKELVVLAPFLLLTLAYATPIISGSKTLRTLPGAKIIVIALCWTGTTVLLPVVYYDSILFDASVMILGVQRLFFVIAITIPFEIRDLSYDTSALKTLPQVVGVPMAKSIGVFLILFSSALLLVQKHPSIPEIVSTAVLAILAALFVLRSSTKQSTYYCSFWVESLPILWLLDVVLCHRLFQ